METRKIKPVIKEVEAQKEVVEKVRINIGEWKFYIAWSDSAKMYQITWYNEKYLGTATLYLKTWFLNIDKAKDYINFFLLSYKQVKCNEVEKENNNRDELPF